jgi:hypothetical protein
MDDTVNYDKKQTGQSLEVLAQILTQDWRGKSAHQGKGYYINGRLSESIYHDKCLFAGPDPDMPVRGLKKYLSAASHLFEYKTSRADLLRPLVIDKDCNTIKAYWRIEGVLNLPWKPRVKPWTGTTTYFIDQSLGLIDCHQETWDISVLDAFFSTLFPWYGSDPAPPLAYWQLSGLTNSTF